MTTVIATGPPLDYSFKELRSCTEIETEEPRSGGARPSSELVREGGASSGPTVVGPGDGGGGEADGSMGTFSATGGTSAAAVAPGAVTMAATATMLGASATGRPSATTTQANAVATVGGPKPRCVVRKVTTSVKLNNNLLETVAGLPEALSLKMSCPLLTLQWLDLSFNQLQTIEMPILKFENLKALYLHGNCLRSLPEVERLKQLSELKILTLNGNPIESCKIYRMYIVGALPKLRSLDHSTITEDETKSAVSWFKSHLHRKKEREERLDSAPAIFD
eukprot:TRINITY_DN45123_c0_g1_i1.p1 TRINITY_DN45123_c0_g1~~TRINITY_DN45123_c0_g1_i1.p1  ORF type:complete len:292 (+),score=64.63 TRINITY_DN45123_c0_g1_i1:43-876(+)